MERQESALDLFLIQAEGQLHKPLHISWIIERFGCSEVIDSESQFKSIVSQVDLVGGVEGIDYSSLGDDRI